MYVSLSPDELEDFLKEYSARETKTFGDLQLRLLYYAVKNEKNVLVNEKELEIIKSCTIKE